MVQVTEEAVESVIRALIQAKEDCIALANRLQSTTSVANNYGWDDEKLRQLEDCLHEIESVIKQNVPKMESLLNSLTITYNIVTEYNARHMSMF